LPIKVLQGYVLHVFTAYLVGAEEPTFQTNNPQFDKFSVKISPVVGIKFGSKNSLAFLASAIS